MCYLGYHMCIYTQVYTEDCFLSIFPNQQVDLLVALLLKFIL